ncbi:unnamed protein product [Protopolystoma xenopodis]|uniref:Uncharacterized protein n=1 Tax=Protopolystoma xenopodis TaxID=117903 RepID=A0A3S5B926_9PLAT|nr:unnamed protein product [Protopolystoma xenopodis]
MIHVAQLLEGRGVDNMMTILKAQVAHKNALIAAVQLAFNARPSFFNAIQDKTKLVYLFYVCAFSYFCRCDYEILIKVRGQKTQNMY